jgi:WD40 repeat protein
LKYLAFEQLDNNFNPWIHIRNLATGKESCRIKAVSTMALAFSADDKTLAWQHYTDRAIVVSDVSTGKELRRLKSVGHNDSNSAGDSALALALSADGKSLAVSWMSRTIEVWDLMSGKPTLPAGKVTSAQYEQHSTDYWSLLARPALAFSPDGKKVVGSLGGSTIRQFALDTGTEIVGPGSGHRGPASTLAMSVDGKSLCTYSPGDPVRLWDWASGKEVGQREVPPRATHAVFAADGRLGFASGHQFSFAGKTWQISDATAPMSCLALSPGGAILATRSFPRFEVHLWDTATGQKRSTFGRVPEGPDISGPVTETTGVMPADLVFSPDGRFLAGGGPSRQLCLWDVATGNVLWQVLPAAGESIERFAFSPGGHVLATFNSDRTLTLYEVLSGTQRGRLGEPDKKNRRVYLTDGSTSIGNAVQMRHDAPVCLAFSPDGRYLATAQHTPEIHLWDILAGRERTQLKGHAGGVVNLLFTRDSKQLISAGTDTTALTWDLTGLSSPKFAPGAKLPSRTLDALWTDLADANAAKAFDAIRRLSASGDQAIELIKKRVRPASPPDPKRLTQLLADMEKDRFSVRRKAESELEALGDLAEPALRKALGQNPPLEMHTRLVRLLDKLARHVHTPELLRDLRSVELLELIGSARARDVLQSLAGGVPSAGLSREADKALQRLTKQSPTP